MEGKSATRNVRVLDVDEVMDTSVSSTVSASRPGAGTVSVYDSVSGMVHEQVPINPEDSAGLAVVVEHLTRVPIKHQILIAGPPYVRVDPKRPLTSKYLFVYDRAFLKDEPPELPAVVVEPLTIDVPTQPPPVPKFDVESKSPLVIAIIEYERHFLLHDSVAKAFAQGALRRQESAKKLASEVRAHAFAHYAAVHNLRDLWRGQLRQVEKFQAVFTQHHDERTTRLNAAEANLQALARVPLHPDLHDPAETRKTLYDCVPTEELRNWAKQCGVAHQSLQSQVQTFLAHLEAAKATIAAIVDAPEPGRDAAAISQTELEAVAREVAQQATAAGKIAEDYAWGHDQIQQAIVRLPSSTNQSTEVLETCRLLEQRHHRHNTEDLPAMKDSDARLLAAQKRIADLKARQRGHLLEQLRTISILQSQIRDFSTHLQVVKDLEAKLEAAVVALVHIEQLPAAYTACIDEVHRRQSFNSHLNSCIAKVSDEFTTLCDTESALREQFLQRHGKDLPRDLVRGLNERPIAPEIRAREFDRALPRPSLGRALAMDPQLFATPGTLVVQATADWDDDLPPEDAAVKYAQMKLELQQARAELSSLKAAMQLQKAVGAVVNQHSMADSSGSDASTHASAAVGAPVSGTPSVRSSGTADEATASNQTAAANVQVTADSDPHTMWNVLEWIKDRVTQTNLVDFDMANPRVLEDPAGVAEMKGGHLMTDTTGSGSAYSTGPLGSPRASAPLQSAVQRMVRRHHHMAKTIRELRGIVESFERSKIGRRISYTSFAVNDVALFLPIRRENAQVAYVAFHDHCPHRYLSEDSLANVRIRGRYPDFVIGRILMIDPGVATKDNNPYHLTLNTAFYVLTVERLMDA